MIRWGQFRQAFWLWKRGRRDSGAAIDIARKAGRSLP